MKILVCEFITGGGLCRDALPQSLAVEGLLMRDALLRDLSQLENIAISLTYDVRVPTTFQVSHAIAVRADADVWQVWQEAISRVDAVWLIAPETDAILFRLSEMVALQGKQLLGCRPEAVKLCASKFATYALLTQANIPTVPTVRLAQHQQLKTTAWVCKPDDGVGCEETVYFDELAPMLSWMQPRQHTHVIQPYQSGIAASLSMLCYQGQSWLLSCNQQHVEIENGQFSYHGGVVNGLVQHWALFEKIANAIASAIPSLAGYVGVDLLVNHDQYWVLEINPRLTSSYPALASAIGYNPAKLILDLFAMLERFHLPMLERQVVVVELPPHSQEVCDVNE